MKQVVKKQGLKKIKSPFPDAHYSSDVPKSLFTPKRSDSPELRPTPYVSPEHKFYMVIFRQPGIGTPVYFATRRSLMTTIGRALELGHPFKVGHEHRMTLTDGCAQKSSPSSPSAARPGHRLVNGKPCTGKYCDQFGCPTCGATLEETNVKAKHVSSAPTCNWLDYLQNNKNLTPAVHHYCGGSVWGYVNPSEPVWTKTTGTKSKWCKFFRLDGDVSRFKVAEITLGEAMSENEWNHFQHELNAAELAVR